MADQQVGRCWGSHSSHTPILVHLWLYSPGFRTKQKLKVALTMKPNSRLQNRYSQPTVKPSQLQWYVNTKHAHSSAFICAKVWKQREDFSIFRNDSQLTVTSICETGRCFPSKHQVSTLRPSHSCTDHTRALYYVYRMAVTKYITTHMRLNRPQCLYSSTLCKPLREMSDNDPQLWKAGWRPVAVVCACLTANR